MMITANFRNPTVCICPPACLPICKNDQCTYEKHAVGSHIVERSRRIPTSNMIYSVFRDIPLADRAMAEVLKHAFNNG